MELRDPAHRVHPRARLMWRGLAVLQSGIALAAFWLASGPWNWFPMTWWAWLILGVALATYVVGMPMIRFSVHRWETTPTAVFTQTGLLRRERRIAPLSRVQTIDFEQGPIARILGLATVRVTTASAAGPLHISGLGREVAEQVVADLTERTGSSTGDAT